MPSTPMIVPFDDGHVVVTWDLGPYYASCPLGLRPVSPEERRRIKLQGHVWRINPISNVEDAYTQFNAWTGSLRTVMIYVIREHAVVDANVTFGSKLRQYRLSMGSTPDAIRVPVPPQVPDTDVIVYVLNALTELGFRAEHGTINGKHVVFVDTPAA